MAHENHLPWYWWRCQGKDCDRKAECLRVEQMSNLGARTPWTDRYCPEIGRESYGFIAIREEGHAQG